jgi:uncharacterized protein YfaA (DUF2138 family)
MFATHPLAEAIAEEMVIFYSSRFSRLTIGERLRRVYAATLNLADRWFQRKLSAADVRC